VVVPVSAAVIRDGAVLVAGERLEAVGSWRELSRLSPGRVVDLGEAILMPGLVNAHCHLDYTHMAGQFPPPKVFSDWLKLITATKAGWDLADYEESWRSGAAMLLRSGTTTVADIEAVPQLLPKVWGTTPLRVLSFLEMIGITPRRPPEVVLRDALGTIASLPRKRVRVGLSPHAPYSTVPELLRSAGQTARRHHWPLCVHVAESALEFEMFASGKGQMFDWLRRSGRDMADCGLGSPVQQLERCGALGENLLAVHVNYLGRHDAALLGRNRVSVVHCPRSHAYFRHEPFAFRRLSGAGVNVCLGTDSLATVMQGRRETVELSMFEEMRALANREPGLSPKQLLRLATLNGARALGMRGQVGELTPGGGADLIALPWSGKLLWIEEAVVGHKGSVLASMVAGRWAIAPPGLKSRVEQDER
jgi:cytosine/adenosine deaminase-related metal-dependent hydrolase